MADTPTELDATVAGQTGPTAILTAPRTRLGRYELDAPLGAGGMAVVYKARDPALDRTLAIKLLRPVLRGPAAHARLLREAQAMARLEHPAVVPIFDVGVEGDEVYLVMPLFGGGTLGDWMRAAPRPWRVVLERFLAAARGLAAAHVAGIVHRDFKPDNVLIGAGGDVRVGDFGLAYSDGPPSGEAGVPAGGAAGGATGPGGEALTETGVRVGTPAYMAPEQITGAGVDARSDQFAFCVSLWEALYGERPFRVDPRAKVPAVESLYAAIQAGAMAPVPAAREAPAWLHAAVVRGLRADPAARWPSMQALIDHLDGRLRRRAQAGVAFGIAVPAAIVAAAVAVGATRAGSGDGARAARRWQTVALLPREARIEAAALAPDGKRIAVVAGGKVLAVASSPGGGGGRAPEQVLVAGGAAGPVLAWAPDGGVVVSGTDGTVAWHAAGRPPRALGAASVFAFTAGGAAVLGDGTSTLRWLDPQGAAATCTLAADVRRIAALATTAAGADHVLAAAEIGPGVHAILRIDRTCREHARIAAPGWAAGLAAQDAGNIWYVRAADPDDDDAPRALVRLDGRGRVVEERALDGLIVALAGVARGGEAFYLREQGGWHVGELGAAGERVGDHAGGIDPTEVKVSPDGAMLATIEDARGRVLRVGPVGGPLGEPVARDAMTVAWSPDSRRLAVVLMPAARPELAVMDVRGTVAHRVPVDGIDLEDGLVWAGDGALVATAADGRNLIRIDLATGAAAPLLDGAGTSSEPEVSPRDGTIAFLAARDGKGGEGVWLRDPAGRVSRLRAGLVSTLRIAWTADGDDVLVHDLGANHVRRFDRRGRSTPLFTASLRPGERLSRLFPAPAGRMFARINADATTLFASVPAI